MNKADKDFLINFSRLSEQDVETLNSIYNFFTGNDLDVRDKMKELWNDFTFYSKQGKKQADWRTIGSDQIIEQWANDMREDIDFFSQNGELFGASEEEVNAMISAADTILEKLII